MVVLRATPATGLEKSSMVKKGLAAGGGGQLYLNVNVWKKLLGLVTHLHVGFQAIRYILHSFSTTLAGGLHIGAL